MGRGELPLAPARDREPAAHAAPPAADHDQGLRLSLKTSDEAAIEAVSLAWKIAFNAGDAAAVAALYAPDAVLAAPGAPALRGSASIREYFIGTIAAFRTSGLTVEDAPLGAVGASGDLGYHWATYTIRATSGAVVDAGKLLTLYRRIDGQWRVQGDTWNSDLAPVAAPAPSP